MSLFGKSRYERFLEDALARSITRETILLAALLDKAGHHGSATLIRGTAPAVQHEPLAPKKKQGIADRYVGRAWRSLRAQAERDSAATEFKDSADKLEQRIEGAKHAI